MDEMEQEPAILTYPNPLLRRKAGRIEDIDQATQDLIDRMTRIMLDAPGIGLAANQLGAMRRVIVFEADPRQARNHTLALINPEIVASEGDILQNEACLSVPDFSADVRRKARVQVRGFDREGNPKSVEAEGLLAVCLQHEIDHLDGILFIDHISSLKKALYKKRLKKLEKKDQNA